MKICVCLAVSLSLAGPAGAGEPLAGAFGDVFLQIDDGKWAVADYDFSHPGFDTDWRRARVVAGDGVTLGLKPVKGRRNGFEGGSLRRLVRSGFGRYEAMIQPARGSGVVTGFFLYTGAYYGTRHDEIDVEFLGRDTTRLHAAWFVDGQLQNRFVDLGFDAADRPRHYAFEWSATALRWFVEDKLVLEITEQDARLPKVPGYLFLNLWAADKSIASWSGETVPDHAAKAVFDWVRFTPFSGGAS